MVKRDFAIILEQDVIYVAAQDISVIGWTVELFIFDVYFIYLEINQLLGLRRSTNRVGAWAISLVASGWLSASLIRHYMLLVSPGQSRCFN